MRIDLSEVSVQPQWVAPAEKRKPPRRSLYIGSTVSLVILVALYLYFSQAGMLILTARLAHERIPIRSKAQGEVVGIYAEKLQDIKKGQMIILLYDPNLKKTYHKIRTRIIEVDKALDIENVENNSALAAASRSLKLSEDYLQVVYDRYIDAKEAFADGLAIRAELESSLNDYMQANIGNSEQLKEYQNTLIEELMRKQIQMEEVDKYVKVSRNLIYTSPISGKVMSLKVNIGEDVRNKELLAEIRINDEYRLYSSILSTKIGELEDGLECQGMIGSDFSMTVKYVGPVTESNEDDQQQVASDVAISFEPDNDMPEEYKSEGDIWSIQCDLGKDLLPRFLQGIF